MDDPLRMYLVLRRGAIDDLQRAGERAGAAAVACVARFVDDPEHAELLERWHDHPGKVCLRARGGQWDQVLAEPHVIAGDPDGACVVALPPRPRTRPGEPLARLQAMAAELEPPPAEADPRPVPDRLTYVLNPSAEMSSGKTIAQIGHAAVMAAETLPDWVAAGCPARVVVPSPAAFARLVAAPTTTACVEDAGLTEVAPGTVTVLALAPS
jgi:hypothetical protein